MIDLAIIGARVVDPESCTDKILNIGIKDGIISCLTENAIDAKRYIDAENLVVTPAFIDIHTHEDVLIEQTSEFIFPKHTAIAAAKGGNALIVTGNCGMSNLPIREYLLALEQQNLPITCLSLVGNVALRGAFGISNYKKADDNQINKMAKLAETAIDDGAIGISAGLQYAPGTSTKEFVELCKIAGDKGKFMAVHMRYDYPEKAIETVEEVIYASKKTGCPIHISHISANVYGNGNIDKVEKLIKESGLDITADVYPYNVWATTVKSAVFDDGFANFNFTENDLEILTGPLVKQFCNKKLFEQLRNGAQDVSVACHNAIPIEDVEKAFCLDFAMIGSDAVLNMDEQGHYQGHPRSSGSAVKFLEEFVLNKKLMSFSEGIKKLTLLPANRLRLSDYGRIQEGLLARMLILDVSKLRNMSKFGQDVCAAPPQGIEYIINGNTVSRV